MVERITSLDSGYVTGDLSVYPEAIDTKETLYDVKNNAQTTLSQSMTYNSKLIIVESTTAFPDKGIIRIGKELVYYNDKTSTIFRDLIRGFAGSIQDLHPLGTTVDHAVTAEPHNAVKDAIINIQENIGTSVNPDEDSLNGILTAQEKKWLAPKAKFRAFPLEGPPPLTVRFQNFSGGEAIRFLWDFGDGGTSTEVNPTHTYVGEGLFTVRLTIFTSLQAQGIAIKKDYINVSELLDEPFMYVVPEMGTTSTTFEFVDQTDGDIVSRSWIFDDGETITIDDPDIHTITHTYSQTGTYNPTLAIAFSDTTVRFVSLNEPIIVS